MIRILQNSSFRSSSPSHASNRILIQRRWASKPAIEFGFGKGAVRAVGIVGMPNIGKSTLFNALTCTQLAQASNYPFCTIEPNVAKVAVPDERLDLLADLQKSNKTIHAQIEFFDIAGLVRGASKGEGLGNKFLQNIREVSVIVHCVRCFIDDDVTHVDKTVDPLRDIDTINTELILADIETLDKAKARRMKKPELRSEVDLIDRILSSLGNGKFASQTVISDTECEAYRNLHLLTAKPVMYASNVKEGETQGNDLTKLVSDKAQTEGRPNVIISAKIEEEIANLDAETKKSMTKEDLIDLGASAESGLSRIIRESRKLLGLQSYYTVGPMEARAWTISVGTKAREAAGVIHSDFEKGFIKADVISYDHYVEFAKERKGKEGDIFDQSKTTGKVRTEGASYVVNDGDIMVFKFK